MHVHWLDCVAYYGPMPSSFLITTPKIQERHKTHITNLFKIQLLKNSVYSRGDLGGAGPGVVGSVQIFERTSNETTFCR